MSVTVMIIIIFTLISGAVLGFLFALLGVGKTHIRIIDTDGVFVVGEYLGNKYRLLPVPEDTNISPVYSSDLQTGECRKLDS